MRRKSFFYIWFIANVITILFYFFGGFDRINYAILNYFFYLSSKLDFSEDIVVIGITDKCLERLGRWPWDRRHCVKLLKILKEGEVKTIGIDILLLEPEGAVDVQLAEVSKELGRVVFSAYFNTEDSRLYLPIPIILQSAFGVGHINVTPAVNGFIYGLPKSISYGDREVKAFSIKVSEAYLGKVLDNIPTEDGNLLINYTGKKPKIIPFSDVLDGRISKEFFKGKLVLIGITAKGLGDYFLAPSYKEPISGLEIHANAVNTIIKGFFPKKFPKTTIIIITLMTALFFLLTKEKPIKVLLLGLLIIFVSFCISYTLFLSSRIIIDCFPIVTSTIFNVGITTIYGYLKEKNEKDRIKHIFQMYLPSEVIEEHLKNPELWNLKGEEVEATVMFVDISGFTKFSQEHKPQEVVEFLNRYFSIVTDIVFKHRGTLDKFIGDAVMVIYGAPIRYKEHPLEALLSAFEIMEVAKGYNISLKIGINTGRMILGNIGTEKRIQYTAIGDTVNMAEYLESIAGPGEIIIGDTTYNEIKNKVIAEKIILTGKYTGRIAYRVISYG
ncbi:adenylate/guanylate cyclase domain-containing protein [bacterium]|nr:adenylate/guanylate cyclase domain-containing protein [bacterium]